ncbi:PREDICTED: uncharacterized protein LOC109168701 [Ipomoea nil]|uniref:uncharacterized protein LOC109168701 n=1 Tax=Ipomoea nil TaxID=35883 RepID=UPI00090137B9|nr:PREDICTED: uncharacterized protein LOC109168701 [Ipomoea nil]
MEQLGIPNKKMKQVVQEDEEQEEHEEEDNEPGYTEPTQRERRTEERHEGMSTDDRILAQLVRQNRIMEERFASLNVIVGSLDRRVSVIETILGVRGALSSGTGNQVFKEGKMKEEVANSEILNPYARFLHYCFNIDYIICDLNLYYKSVPVTAEVLHQRIEHTKALPQLVGDNYAYWKVRTCTHLKAQGEAVWCIIVTSWVHPTKSSTSDDATQVTKPENEWTQAEKTSAGYNDKALDIIYGLIHESQFPIIAGHDSAKGAWEALEATYEGTSSVKQSKLQLVQSDFEELRMNEDETIVTFHTRVQELENRAMVLGEPFTQEQFVKKILRSLPPRFRMKVTAIQEHDNWEKETVTQLMGNLRTYEMEILTDHTKKPKTVAFTAEENNCTPDLYEIGDDPVVFLTKQFSKLLKQVSKGSRNKNMQKGASSSKTTSKSGSSTYKPPGSRPSQSKEKPNSKGIRCYECEGFGHVQAECPTYLRRKKSMSAVTWSDDDSDGETGGSDPDEISGNFVAFTAHTTTGPCHEEVADSEGGEYNSAEDLESSESSFEIEFNKLYPKWAALRKENRRLTSEIGIVTTAKKVYQTQVVDRDLLLKEALAREEKLKQEVQTLKQELSTYKRQIQMMDTTSTLDEILESGRKTSTKFGLGFTGNSSKDKTVFIKASGPGQGDIPESSTATRQVGTVRLLKPYYKSYNPVCHYCRINVDETELWHQKLGHLSYRLLDKLVKIEGVRGLPKLKVKPTICGACQAGKQTKSSHPAQHTINTSYCLELIHMDLIGPTQTESVGGITHEYSAPKTPQQNGVVERKNRTIQEMGRVLLNAKGLPQKFWAEAVNTAYHIINRDRNRVAKFETKSDEGIFLGYATNSRAYRVYNKVTKTIMESTNVVIDDQPSDIITTTQPGPVTEPDTSCPEPNPESPMPSPTSTQPDQETESESESDTDHSDIDIPTRIQKAHPIQNVIGDPSSGVKTRGKPKRDYLQLAGYSCYTSQIEPKNVKEALTDEHWIKAMQEELGQYQMDLCNKTDAAGNIARNKARLVTQGYSQIEGIDYDETFAPVARLESIRLLLSIACALKFKLFQMDVKTAFLNGYLSEDIYVAQPKGFEDPHHPDYVYKLQKALYGLKQAPKAWYERLTQYLLQNNYKRGGSDKTLFIKRSGKHITIAQVYVDDIVFGSTQPGETDQLVKVMQQEFEMSMIGELTYFLGLQVSQTKEGIFISQEKYAKNLLSKFGLESAKDARTPISTTTKLFKDEKGTSVDPTMYRSMIGSLLYLTASRPDIMVSVGMCARYQADPKESHLKAVKRIIKYVKGTINYGIWYSSDTNLNLAGYSDADWAGNADDRKSTSGGCFFIGKNLVAWLSKKQNSISLSTAEAEYIAAGSCCTQLLWMRQMLIDYGIEQQSMTLFCDNTSAINISKNPVQHSRTKHIDIRHHFIRELVEEKEIIMEYTSTDKNLADLFTKPLDKSRFELLRAALGVCNPTA